MFTLLQRRPSLILNIKNNVEVIDILTTLYNLHKNENDQFT